MERGPLLRAVTNKKLVINGEYHISRDKTCILFTDFIAVDDKEKTRKVLNEGDIVTLTTQATIRSVDRVITLRANPMLYAKGSVRMIPLLAPSDNTTQIGISFKADGRVDLSKLTHLVEAYING